MFFASISCFSQEPKKWEYSYTCHYFGIHDGLAQSQVFASFQDTYGYIWFSTNGGVSRFDGLHFDNYSFKELHTGSSRIKYFNQYESAVYMVSPRSIVFVYPDRTMEYYPFPDDYVMRDNEIAIDGNYIYLANIQSINEKSICYVLLRFDLKNKTFTRIAENLPYLNLCVSEQKVYAISALIIKNQQIRLFRIDKEQLKTIRTIRMDKNNICIVFAETKRKDLFAIIVKEKEQQHTNYLYRCFIENDSICWDYLTEMPMYFGDILSIERLDEHRFLFGGHPLNDSYSGFILDTDKRNISPFPLELLIVNNILIDRDNNIWFSTEEGVYQCSRFLFETYRLGLGRNDNIWSVIKDDQGSVWFSSYSYGFWRADAKGNLHQVRTFHNSTEYFIKMGYMSNCKDNRGRIFQTGTGGLVIYDPKQGHLNRVEITLSGVLLAVYHDTETGDIYFGGDNDSCRTLHVLRTNGDISTYQANLYHIVSIGRDANRKLRIGTFYGEAWLDEVNHVIVSDTVKREYTGIISMASDEKGLFWKGTTHGLFVENTQGKDRQITEEEVLFVLNYKNRYLIWGVKNRLYLLDLPVFHKDAEVCIHTFGFYDGFDLQECGQNGASIDSEDYVWIAGGNKVIRFRPEQIMNVPLLPAASPYLSAIYNVDKNSNHSLVPTGSSFVFDNKNNGLRFDILHASVTAPDKLVFRYKLNGYNKQWSTTNNRSLIFQNLPHGKYCLELQSSVDREQWSESIFSPLITIRKPFWLTFPGLSLIFAVMAGIIILIIHSTYKFSIQKEKNLRMIDHLKHRAVKSKFIPHFTGNALNSINYLILKDPDLAQKYISDFACFSHHTLLNFDNFCTTIQKEIEYCKMYLKLEKLRFEENLVYSIHVAPDVDTKTMIPIMIVQTFCENALKHGLRHKPDIGVIQIKVMIERKYTRISVEDNGIGREKAASMKTEGTREGLKIVNQQMQLYNKIYNKNAYFTIIDLHDVENRPVGTRCELFV